MLSTMPSGDRRQSGTELSEQSSSWGSYAEGAIFHDPSEKVSLLPGSINLVGILNSVRRPTSNVLDRARDVTLQRFKILAKRREIGIRIRRCIHDGESPIVAKPLMTAMRGDHGRSLSAGEDSGNTHTPREIAVEPAHVERAAALSYSFALSGPPAISRGRSVVAARP
jgi:hypothetical protein